MGVVALDPPLSVGERRRDQLLTFLDSNRWILYINATVYILIVAMIVLWLFMVTGWQSLCTTPSPTNCEPRNTIYNAAIHALTSLFVYLCAICFPWRIVHLMHSLGWSRPCRSNEVGHDLYGLLPQPDDTKWDPWFFVPRRKRVVVLIFLLASCLIHFTNQICRGIYYSYELGNSWPGEFLTNTLFVISLICAIVGATLFGRYTGLIRRTNPQRFGLGPLDSCKERWSQRKQKQQKRNSTTTPDTTHHDGHQQTALVKERVECETGISISSSY